MAGGPQDKAAWLKRIQNWAVTLLALTIATMLVDGIRYETPGALIMTAVVLGLMHEFVRPALLVLTLPLLVVTLTLFRFVINALLLGLAGSLVPGFEVKGFWSAFWGALIMSILMTLFQAKPRAAFSGWIDVNRPARPRGEGRREPRRDDDMGSGPVIDV